jgi:hypothetical protein
LNDRVTIACSIDIINERPSLPVSATIDRVLRLPTPKQSNPCIALSSGKSTWGKNKSEVSEG